MYNSITQHYMYVPLLSSLLTELELLNGINYCPKLITTNCIIYSSKIQIAKHFYTTPARVATFMFSQDSNGVERFWGSRDVPLA